MLGVPREIVSIVLDDEAAHRELAEADGEVELMAPYVVQAAELGLELTKVVSP
jgi:hypothetical protein